MGDRTPTHSTKGTKPGRRPGSWRRLALALLAVGAPLALAAQSTTVTIPAGNGGGAPDAGSGIFPFSTIFKYMYSADIYTSAEIGRGGYITEVRYYVEAVNNPQPAPVKLYLKQRASETFPSFTNLDAERAGATLAFSGTLPASAFVAGQWVSVPLSQPFNYDPASNLQVYVETVSARATENLTNQKQFRYSAKSAAHFYSQGTFQPTDARTIDDRRNIQLVFGPVTACTGTPAAGAAVASPAGFCDVGTPVTLSLAGAATGAGLAFQWQRSADGVAYTDVAGATSYGYTTPALSSGPVWFRARVACGAQAATSAPVQVSERRPAYAALPVAEGFENAWVDACDVRDVPGPNWRTRPVNSNASWRRNDDGAAAGWFDFGAYTPAASQGAHSARYHSVVRFDPQDPPQGNFDLFVNLGAAGAKTLAFDYINPTGNDRLEVLLSTDGGATFGAPLLTLGTTSGFAPQTLTLTATSATSVIRFRGNFAAGADDLGLDNVRVTAAAGPTASRGALGAGALRLYPNPARSAFSLELPAVAGATTAHLQLFNALGQAVRTQTLALPATGAQARVAVAGLPAGLYTVRVHAGGQSASLPVAVE